MKNKLNLEDRLKLKRDQEHRTREKYIADAVKLEQHIDFLHDMVRQKLALGFDLPCEKVQGDKNSFSTHFCKKDEKSCVYLDIGIELMPIRIVLSGYIWTASFSIYNSFPSVGMSGIYAKTVKRGWVRNPEGCLERIGILVDNWIIKYREIIPFGFGK